MDIDQTLIDDIKGFLDPEEGRGLYEVARRASQLGPCLEIGSYCGKSAFYLGRAELEIPLGTGARPAAYDGAQARC